MEHPAIDDAAVIGIDLDDGRGELPRAYIVPAPVEQNVTDDELLRYMGNRLAKYKLPAGGIARIRCIPRNASGKILRRLLRERAFKEMRGEEVGEDAVAVEDEDEREGLATPANKAEEVRMVDGFKVPPKPVPKTR